MSDDTMAIDDQIQEMRAEIVDLGKLLYVVDMAGAQASELRLRAEAALAMCERVLRIIEDPSKRAVRRQLEAALDAWQGDRVRILERARRR